MSFQEEINESGSENSTDSSTSSESDDYFDLQTAKATNLTKLLSENVHSLSKMVEKIGFPQDTQRFRVNLNSLRSQTRLLSKKTIKCIQNLREIAELGTDHAKCEKLNNYFNVLFNRFKSLDELSIKKQKEYVPTEKEKNEKYYEKEQKISLIDDQKDRKKMEIFYQEQEILMKNEIIKETTEGILTIETELNDVNEMFKNMAKIVNDQKDDINQLQQNVVETNQSIIEGNVDLEEAAEMDNQSRPLRKIFLASEQNSMYKSQSLTTKILSYRVNFIFILIIFVIVFSISSLITKTSKTTNNSDLPEIVELTNILNSIDQKQLNSLIRLTDKLSEINSDKIDSFLDETKENLVSKKIKILKTKEIVPIDKEIKFEIPKILFQTYYAKSKIPQKVYENIAKYAPGYKHVIYDDEEGLAFLEKHFDKNVVQAYRKLNMGAHKADLLRYAFLYINGGVYLDIKTELVEPISETLGQNSILTGLSIFDGTFMTGFIATYEKNQLFYDLVEYIGNLQLPLNDYLHLVSIFYQKTNCLVKDNIIQIGKIENPYYPKSPYYFYKEKCTSSENDCYDGLDRYGRCCWFIDEFGKNRIKVRYADYPWK
ncbi:inositol phosphoceramide mannosyltransferase 1 [Anaeramoeba flamelloides]|uniref:Inositol phosphoceramide mannosyltransferase 1 n=1 Tax=Anaeramoeba flamelloides TaxID=1746091 RepID=A0ABQ8Y8C6_9EUKA|nr:inositol phosphoceramide mannosyltransferase 1 [Anaeramoeba flamelloides]